MFSGRINSTKFTVQLLLIVTTVSSLLGLANAGAGAQNSTKKSELDTTKAGNGFHSLAALYKGNEKFRNAISGVSSASSSSAKRLGRKRAAPAAQVALKQLAEETPSFMFLGCTDNRLTPASIFQAPVGSILTHNNIGNQYSKKDTSTDAAITYAIEDLGVQHIIVLGHYDCKGAARAITGSKKHNSISKWVEPLLRLYKKARRRDVVKYRDSRLPRRGQPHGAPEPPNASESGFRAFVEENVKATVKALREDSILAKAYQTGAKTRDAKDTDIDVYVHGWVYDDNSGKISDLQVSFGPPGKPIPPIPFQAAPAARKFHMKPSKFNKGKVLEKPKYIIE